MPFGVFAVVVTVSWLVEDDTPFKVTDWGESEHVEFGGAPLQLSDTALLKPLTGARVIVDFPEAFFATVKVEGEAEIVKSIPVPDSATVCGLPLMELSLMANVADRDPAALGVNVMLRVQVEPAVTRGPQLLV